MDHIQVQENDIDVAEEYQALRNDNTSDGAIVFFTGLVRDLNQGQKVTGLFLEHYPAMTNKVLADIVAQAKQRWPINRVRLIHRVGQLSLNEQIVFVAVSSAHREAAFDACRFIMDFLKNQAPFWKKETTEHGSTWVEANKKDQVALKQWFKGNP